MLSTIWWYLRFPIFIGLVAWICVLYYPGERIDPKLKPYYTHFKKIQKKVCDKPFFGYDKKATIEFADLNHPEIGSCQFLFYKYTIRIDRTFWKISTPAEKFQVLMHELTHCELPFLTHVDSLVHYMGTSLSELGPKDVQLQMIHLMQEMCPND